MINKTTVALAGALSLSSLSHADIVIPINDSTIAFGGYLKADLRNVNGDIAYRDFWVGNNKFAPGTNETRFQIRESRMNIKVTHGDIKGVVEWDFLDDQQPTGTTETVTGGHSLRLRHVYIQSGHWMIGQNWTTFMPLASIADSLDFGGALVGQSLIRQGMIRYTNGGLQLAVENPSTQDGTSQSVPDAIAKYTFKGNWGQVAVAGLVRNMDDGGDTSKADGVQTTYNIHGRLKVGARDDFRFSYHAGDGGRYVSPGANISDNATNGDIYDADAFTLAYRHVWNDDWRSSLYYGQVEIDEIDADRKHTGLNLIRTVTKNLEAGAEVGQYKTESGQSDYYQLSLKYKL